LSTLTATSQTARSFGAGLVLAALGAIAFSGKAIIVKLSYRYGVDATTVIMYRMLFAFPLFLAMVVWANTRALGQALPLSRADILAILGLGFTGYYLSSYLDFLGLQYVSAGLERLILYLSPTFVMLLGRVLYKKRVPWMRIVAMAISYAGICVVFWHEVNLSGTNVVLGSFWVFASALSYSVYLIASGQLVHRIGSLRLVGTASSVACVCCIVQFVCLKPLSAVWVPLQVIELSMLNALVCTAAPVLMVMLAIERIGPALTSQVGMVGPLATLLLGVLILDEPFNSWIALGTSLVIGGIYLVTQFGTKEGS
jgi:drug/metabolite transporter (DMT)-like permease